eukprot:TRINITY_DN7731_c0_g1_i1.p1 TRINITY_DN7731_c0_g1~~TRINITY_DN7731_c0_g1_i1.p1  ORF type:complete len:262 (+),score=53.62 TRINITY_DN7731_c0_g1_i1:49-834(+)
MTGQSKSVPNDGQPLTMTEIFQKARNSFVFCWAAHFLADFFWRKSHPKAFYKQPFASRIEFPERIVSTLHGLIVGLGALKEVFAKKTFESGSLATRYTPSIDSLFSFSLGYEVYDIMTMLVQQNQPAAMFAHHIMCILGYIACMLSRRVAFYPVTFLITELTIVPTNINWYLKILEASPSLKFLNTNIRLLSYLLFRTPISAYVIGKTIQRNEWSSLAMVPKPLLALLVLNVVGMSFLNVVWSVGMVSVYRKELARFMRRQ